MVFLVSHGPSNVMRYVLQCKLQGLLKNVDKNNLAIFQHGPKWVMDDGKGNINWIEFQGALNPKF